MHMDVTAAESDVAITITSDKLTIRMWLSVIVYEPNVYILRTGFRNTARATVEAFRGLLSHATRAVYTPKRGLETRKGQQCAEIWSVREAGWALF